MSEEEVPFKSIKITLSEEALRVLSVLRKRGSFRSNSMTVEECLRAIFDITVDFAARARVYAKKGEDIPQVEEQRALRSYLLRLARFIETEKAQKMKETKASAGT